MTAFTKRLRRQVLAQYDPSTPDRIRVKSPRVWDGDYGVYRPSIDLGFTELEAQVLILDLQRAIENQKKANAAKTGQQLFDALPLGARVPGHRKDAGYWVKVSSTEYTIYNDGRRYVFAYEYASIANSKFPNGISPRGNIDLNEVKG